MSWRAIRSISGGNRGWRVAASYLFARAITMVLLGFVVFPVYACEGELWYQPPPSRNELFDLYEAQLPKSAYAVVIDPQRTKAIDLLKDTKFAEISPAEAERLTGVAKKHWVSGATFLLRGVRYPTTNSSFSIYYKNRKVLVYFSYLGPGLGAPLEAPIVAILPQSPINVYQMCTGVT